MNVPEDDDFQASLTPPPDYHDSQSPPDYLRTVPAKPSVIYVRPRPYSAYSPFVRQTAPNPSETCDTFSHCGSSPAAVSDVTRFEHYLQNDLQVYLSKIWSGSISSSNLPAGFISHAKNKCNDWSLFYCETCKGTLASENTLKTLNEIEKEITENGYDGCLIYSDPTKTQTARRRSSSSFSNIWSRREANTDVIESTPQITSRLYLKYCDNNHHMTTLRSTAQKLDTFRNDMLSSGRPDAEKLVKNEMDRCKFSSKYVTQQVLDEMISCETIHPDA
ncbi:uncharacterized protein IL334_002150 [Kwoniella shivajii]|uniref:Uncharacterized protein n=1 Tax=Kwoniella shivajii TaxID=564305 RepID=A0ABZ1CV23_9TREE|nr:hypothetical protein IL334_002150 [Kwoniella shivajii]